MNSDVRDQDMTEPASAAGKRSRSRDSLFLTAHLRIGDEPEGRDVRIRNLSAGGMMAEFPRPVAIDTAVLLDMRGIGEVSGRVAWCAEGRLGIALDRPIDPLRARKPVGGGAKTPFYAKAAAVR